jgi:hypothetical protein
VITATRLAISTARGVIAFSRAKQLLECAGNYGSTLIAVPIPVWP